MTRRAARKKLGRKFAVGDLVTWGNRSVSRRVLQVTSKGVIVDTTEDGVGSRSGGRLTMLIEFAPGSRSRRCPGPPVLVAGKEQS